MTLSKFTISLCLLAFSFNGFASNDLLQKTQQAHKEQKTHNKQREAGFSLTEAQFNEQRQKLLTLRENLQTETNQLSEQFSQNEQTLAELEQKLRLETGSLGELFGVVRQSAKELSVELGHSVTAIDRQQYTPLIDDIVAAKALPSLDQLTGLWRAIEEQVSASKELTQVDVTYVNGEGYTSSEQAYRLGSLGLVDSTGYINWDGARGVAKPYLKQPNNGPTAATLVGDNTGAIVLDPSRGIMLEQVANAPELKDRLEHGGVVGKIILGLLALGIVIALYRGAVLLYVRQQIRSQLKSPSTPKNNPLGRVLAVYDQEQKRSVEALELRLLETIVDEQQGLEKGLSMLKLLAALAPMLGLLGTVTGMIETFQVITQFGNGDPKVMAGGISMALVTTVLGLVSAMPMLLAHNILSTQAENIRNILEKQSISLVAEQAEKADVLGKADQVEKAA
ncbi:MotA/TolQ/ExbB proton channel family protein [Vibrio tapetis]|uniref:MotA/TolQ/ExbB proton channel family protein n=1 Tax=Vibrio tapetis subsp. tapetis TaxID=1671868 RepID=A0A2N8ZD07_9VIBR|nr:MotA/TolQ/ExbB proton channel family protein [Vibrio tapetis]SON49776.1 MotA/TolQ/ExbB proton channel family protein [Vibrio tapetis subsp. tapetis]